MSTAPVFSNPDQALIHRFLEGDGAPIAMDGNPLSRALHCSLHAVSPERDRLEIEFEPDALFIQGTNVLQGGAVSAMLDFAMAFVTLAHIPVGTNCSTVDMSTSFLRPAPKGRYRAIGELDRCGKTLAFARARLLRCDGEVLVATASSTLALF
jgi:uncharacterized protein (TIGR00369 family)